MYAKFNCPVARQLLFFSFLLFFLNLILATAHDCETGLRMLSFYLRSDIFIELSPSQHSSTKMKHIGQIHCINKKIKKITCQPSGGSVVAVGLVVDAGVPVVVTVLWELDDVIYGDDGATVA